MPTVKVFGSEQKKNNLDENAVSHADYRDSIESKKVDAPIPQSSAEWDYKTSPVNQKGESLPSGAEGWTPYGDPYFGKGLSGTLKKYAWKLMGSPTQGAEEDRWARFEELTRDQQSVFSPEGRTKEAGKKSAEATKLGLQGLIGTPYSQETAEADWGEVTKARARQKQIAEQYRTPNGVNISAMPANVQQEYRELGDIIMKKSSSAAEGATSKEGVSLLAPVVRLTEVGVSAALDVFSEAAVKFEQLQGTHEAMTQYAQEQGGLIQPIAYDIDRESDSKWEVAENLSNIASKIVFPPILGWNALAFWSAPGTLKEKQQAVSEGWDAGRILYSQAIKPALLEEYKRRASAGEDPQILAMELQNPWAEAVGQAVLDPLNFVGAGAKAAKIAGQIDDARDAVRGGQLGEAAAELLKDTQNLGEVRAAEKMDNLDNLLVENVKRIEDARLTPDYNKMTAYSPTGMRVKEHKVVMDASNQLTAAVMRGGGTPDDVLDVFKYVTDMTSLDKVKRGEAVEALITLSNRHGLGRYIFSDDVLETGVLLRNLIDDKDFLTVIKKGKGDLAETAKLLEGAFQRAVEKQVPTYTEAKKAAEAFKTGKDTGKQAERLTQMYEGVKNKAAWNLHEGKAGEWKGYINSTMGKFFFSQPGFVARNASNNFMTMFVDQGLTGTAKSFYRDGKFWSEAAITEDMTKYFGGKLPSSFGGMSLSKSEKAESFMTKLNDKVEGGFAKRIYWKNFRDTMDKFLTPGVALPSRAEFKAKGLNESQIDHLVHIVRNEAGGDLDKALQIFSENGPDVWKRWNNVVSKNEMSGLTEMGLTKEVDGITSRKLAPQQIKEEFARLKRETLNRAATATDNPIGVSRERTKLDFMDEIGKAEKKGLVDVDGTNRLNILIEQSEKATDEMMRAIGRARNTVTDVKLRKQFDVMEQAFSAERRTTVVQTSQNLTKTARSLTDKARSSTGLQIEKLWNESILAKQGPPPPGLTQKQFLNELWDATRNDVSNTWEVYFSEGFDQLTPLIDNLTEQFPEISGIFKRAQKSSAELNMYRTAAYRDGKIFYTQYPKNVTELANRYGVTTATEQGVPANKELLATINKYSDKNFKTLEEAEQDLQTVERAFQNRSAAKGTGVVEDVSKQIPPTDSPQFKKWFGESKLVDDSGKPKIFYHGTSAKFSEFDMKKVGQTDAGFYGKGFTFTEDPEIAKGYALGNPLDPSSPTNKGEAIVMPVYLRMKKPLEIDVYKPFPREIVDKIPKNVKDGLQAYVDKFFDGDFYSVPARDWSESMMRTDFDATQVYKSAGYDGAIITDKHGTEYLLWDNKQIKSTKNTGGFNPEKADIYDTAEVTQGFDTNAKQSIEKYMASKGFRPEDIPEGWYKLSDEELKSSPATIALSEYRKMGQPIPGVAPKKLDVNINEAEKAADLEYYKKALNVDDIKAKARKFKEEQGVIPKNPEVQITPPYVDGSTPIPGNMWKESSDGVIASLNKIEEYMLENYGLKEAGGIDINAVKSLLNNSRGNVTEAVAIADKVGKEWRDFALLPYGETKNYDLALSYAYPYQFWYSRSYANWMKRLATDPQVIANYARLKEAMSKVNKDSPEWWRYNVETPANFLGIFKDPMSFNLEANLWPLYGLTGTNFEDPQRRTNWFTATVDDMGKMGPSVWSPIQWGIALAYRAQGENEQAQAWASRAIPQTATIKALSSYVGQPLELDPMVQMFSGKGIMDTGAMDKYERNRVGRALVKMQQEGLITNEQMIEVARNQEGPVWDEATRRATQVRAPGQIASFMLGVGMKARTEEDRITDEFYQKYYRLQNLNEADLISPEKYQEAWDGLRNEYPFMDALLLSRKAGPDRDRAYAYNVFGRIPPGQSKELYNAVGLDPELAQKFYDSKGNMKDWSDSDKDRLLAAAVDLGAMLAIPEFATKQEWNEARAEYKGIQEEMKSLFGNDIQDQIDFYYSLEDSKDREFFSDRNPQVKDALEWQNEQIVSDDLLYSYYGGISSLEKYASNKMYDQLYKEFGADIGDKWNTYYDMQITDPLGAKKFYKAHPELKRYSKRKDQLEAESLRFVVEFGAKLPEEERPELTGNEPENAGQRNVQNYAQRQTPPFEYWRAEMPEVTTVIAQYWSEGEDIPSAVKKNLDYAASAYGYESGEDLLRDILISLNR